MMTDEEIASQLAVEAPKTEIANNIDEQIALQLDAPVDEEKKETIVETPIVKKDEDEAIELEDEIATVTQEEKIDFDFSEIGVEVKSKSELKEFISSLKNERDTFKNKSQEVYANDKIRELNDYVKNGGDIEAYTNNIQTLAQYKATLANIDKITPTEAYKFSILQQFGVNSVAELPESQQQELEDYLESKPSFEKEMEGRKLLNAEKQNYQNAISNIEKGIEDAKQSLVQKNEQYKTNVSKAVQSLTGVDGIKVKDSEKQELMTVLADPKKALQDLMPLDENGLPDAGALARIIYREKFGAKNTKLLLKQAKSAGAKEVFSKVTNSSGLEINQHAQQGKVVNELAQAVNEFIGR